MLSLLAANRRADFSRRRFLQLGLTGLAGAGGLAPALSWGKATSNGRAAKHCIYIYLCGGPSQIDMWDPKPEASEGIRSEWKTIETNVPGIRFTELIPNVARHADKLAIIRSMTHNSPDHNMGSSHTLHGYHPGRPDNVYVAPTDHPGLGGILHKLKGDSGLVPPWVILPRPFTTSSPPIKGQSGGFLGPAFDPVMLDEPKINSLAPKDLKFSQFDMPAGVGRDRMADRRRLRGLSDLPGHIDGRWDALAEKATDLLSGERCARAFDLTREDPRIRDRYGRNEYGQSFLLARRLVEAGVRFVNVFWTFFDEKGCQFNLWDNHGIPNVICGVGGVNKGREMILHPYCTPSFDRAFPALLEDLESRGLLDDTLVAVAGEFGRTPRINQYTGRDHWPNCYSQLLAGGGIRGGQVYGASDRNAAYVKDNPVRPEDFQATILHAFGIDTEAFLTDPLQRPIRVTGGEPVRGLF